MEMAKFSTIGIQNRGLHLEGFRLLLGARSFGVAALQSVPGGVAFKITNPGAVVWLIAEQSKQVRVFKRADTALNLCRQLGLKSVTVELHEISVPMIQLGGINDV